MDFEPSDDQRLLVESVSGLLADIMVSRNARLISRRPKVNAGDVVEVRRAGPSGAAIRRGIRRVWRRRAGGDAGDAGVGRVLVLEPYLGDGGTRRHGDPAGGTDEQKPAILPAIAEGSLKLAFAHGERQARYDCRCRNHREAERRRLGAGWLKTSCRTAMRG